MQPSMRKYSSGVFPRITTAQIMTPREDWLALRPEDDRAAVLAQARAARFDIVPVLDASGKPVSFLWAASGDEQPLTLDWCLTHDTPLEKTLSYFAEDDQRKVAFLWQEREVVGLVTPADFGKAIARMGMYVYLAELEILLAQFLRQFFQSDEQILGIFPEGRRQGLIRRAKKNDLPVLEVLYIRDLFYILGQKEYLWQHLGFSVGTQVNDIAEDLSDFRNFVAHPVKSNSMPIGEVANRLERASDLISRLRKALDKSAGRSTDAE